MSFQQRAAKLAKMLNISPDYEFQGKVYQIKDATIKQRAEFATWVEQRALDAIHRMKMNDEDCTKKEIIQDMQNGLLNAIAAGAFEWGGEPVMNAVESRVGQLHLLYILLKADHPEVTEDIAEAMMDARHKDIARRVEDAFQDPKVLSELEASGVTIK